MASDLEMKEAEELIESLTARLSESEQQRDEAVAYAERLRGVLQRAREDINWMLNSRQFLNGHVFDYLDAALSTASAGGKEGEE